MTILPYILILAGMQLGVPVRCYDTQTEWKENKSLVQTSPQAYGYFHPQEVYIALGPQACKSALAPNLYGASILAHELTHYAQYLNDLPYSEGQADSMSYLIMHSVLKKLERYLGRKAKVTQVVKVRG